MRKMKLILAALLAVGQLSVGAQTTVFKDVFSGSAKGGKIVTKATPSVAYTSNLPTNQENASGSVRISGGTLVIVPGKPENADDAKGNLGYVIGETAKFGAPYQSILSKNQGTVTWYTGMQYSRTASLSSTIGEGKQAMVTILACDKADPKNPEAKGYGLFLMGAGKSNRLFLIHFTKGIGNMKRGDESNTIIAQGPNVPFGGESYTMAKVTYKPSSNTWELATADVADNFRDPLKVKYGNKSGEQVNDGATNIALPYFGFASGFSKSSGWSRFDNFYVIVE